MKKNTRHLKLKYKLLDLIQNSAINDPLPSERHLAKENDVCRATVAKVMVELEREGYITRRAGKGSFVSPKDKMLLNGSEDSNTQGNVIILYPDFYSHLIWERVHFAELAALRNKINLLNLKMQQESSFESIFKIIARQKNLQGVIISPGGELPPDFIQNLDKLGIPIVLLGMMPSQSKYENIYIVRVDYFKSGYLKTDHLLQNGHRRIGLILTQPPSHVSTEHLKGIKQALYDNDLRLRDLVVSEKNIKSWADPMKIGHYQTKKLLQKHKVTGLIFESVRGAFGGLRALYELGLKCPDDVSMLASQSSFAYEEMTCPALTNVNSNNDQALTLAMDLILNPNTECKNYVTDIFIFPRESVKDINLKQ